MARFALLAYVMAATSFAAAAPQWHGAHGGQGGFSSQGPPQAPASAPTPCESSATTTSLVNDPFPSSHAPPATFTPPGFPTVAPPSLSATPSPLPNPFTTWTPSGFPTGAPPVSTATPSSLPNPFTTWTGSGFPTFIPMSSGSASPSDAPLSTSDAPAPPLSTAAPPSSTAAPPSSTAAPPSSTAAPPSSTAAPPSSTAAPPSSTAAPPSGPADSKVPDADRQALLDAHNSARAAHGAPALTWSAELETYAQAWADGCKWGHSGGKYGENIAGGADAAGAVKMWVDEGKDYVAGDPNFVAGHFTQVVWKATTELGCGIAHCKGEGEWDPYVVCSYNPPGNFRDDKSYADNVQA